MRGRERGMQGPGDSDPGEEAAEATLDARSVSAHGRAGGVLKLLRMIPSTRFIPVQTIRALPVQTIRALQRWLKSILTQKTSCLWRLCKSTKTPSSVPILLGWISNLPGRSHSSHQLCMGIKTPSSATILLGRPSSLCQSQSK